MRGLRGLFIRTGPTGFRFAGPFHAMSDQTFHAPGCAINRGKQVGASIFDRHGSKRRQPCLDVAIPRVGALISIQPAYPHHNPPDSITEPAQRETQSALRVSTEYIATCGVPDTKVHMHGVLWIHS